MVDLSLVQDFITEALEHLEELESSLLKLEQEPDERETLDDIFRAVHTIKGAAQFTGLPKTSDLSHKFENLLDLLRQGRRQLNQEVTDTLIDTKDRLSQLTNELDQFREERSEIDDLLARIGALVESPGESEAAAAAEQFDNEPETPALETPQAAPADGELEEQLLAALDMSVLEEAALAGEESAEATPAGDGASEPLAGDVVEQNPAIVDPIADALIIEEIAGESYDEELARIFLQQTEKKYATVRELMLELPMAADKDDLFAQAVISLGNLKAAANYMGYANLTRFFGNWLDQIAAARREIAAGSEAALDFMTAYADQLARVMPQISTMAENAGGGVAAAAGSGAGVALQEGREASVTGSGPVDEGLIRAEVAEETFDEELFDIFINQLNTNLSAIRSQLEECKEVEHKAELLERCEGNLAAMKASANYMGYANLHRFYESWQRSINEAMMGVARDEEIDLDALLGFVGRLVTLVPGADAHYLADTGSGRPSEEAAGSEYQPEIMPERGGRLEKSGPVADTSTADEGVLFDALSASVDLAASADAAESSSMHGILEQMLGGDATAADALAEPVLPAAETAPEQGAQQQEDGKSSKDGLPSEEGKGASPSGEEQEEKETAPERRKLERRLGDRRQVEASGTSIYKHTIRVDSAKIDSLMNQVGELVVSKAYFAQILSDLRSLHQELKEIGLDQRGQKPIRELGFKLTEATVSLSRVSNELQEGVMKVRMLPVSQLFNRYPRLVRDLVHKTDKKVELVIKGEDTELDKMVIEEISDPLIHIIRNAVDHGIEPPAERRKSGKPETSTLTLEAYHESNHIVIEVTDDGRGINVERIKAKALQKGLVGEHELERMSDAEAKRFIMMPGFSTAEKPNETSGRGVGMDVIKTNIEKLNGTVEVDSQPGVYTRIRIKIPLTLAIIQALLIRVGSEIYTIPLSVVEETLRIYEHETSVIEGVEVIHLRDTTMPIFKLSDLFNVRSERQDLGKSFVVIVTTGMQKIGLVVDELMGQEEVVIKPLVDYLREESGFSGATIIGDGRISLILDIYELVKLTSERQASRYKKFASLNKMKRGQILQTVAQDQA